MRKVSIRVKITLWFSAALVVIVGLAYVIVLAASNSVIQKGIRDVLIETVENNVDEVEYYASLDDLNQESDVDHYMEYENGYLEIDDDFLDEVNEVYTSLYRSDKVFLYGENPIAYESSDMDFLDRQIQKIKVKNTLYYIFDCQLTAEGLDSLWLRGVVSEKQGEIQMQSIYTVSLILLPALVLLAIIGGYFIAGRMLRPIHQMTEIASQISQGDDLKKRIDIGEGTDELHQLADTFNEMFSRLDTSFEKERQFTSDASHELRTPMAVIMAQCEYSLEHPCDTEEYIDSLSVIQRQGRRMSKLINDMLVFMRLELRADHYQKQKINFSQLAESICADMAMIQEKNITLQYEIQPEVFVYGNPELLSRLLTNLISNSYRYGKENGKIKVILKEAEDHVCLRVADDGVGIAEENLEKIFHRFYQVDSSHSETGSGLGLSMVKEIAEFHNGKIGVKSTLGEGSVFELTLKKISSEQFSN